MAYTFTCLDPWLPPPFNIELDDRLGQAFWELPQLFTGLDELNAALFEANTLVRWLKTTFEADHLPQDQMLFALDSALECALTCNDRPIVRVSEAHMRNAVAWMEADECAANYKAGNFSRALSLLVDVNNYLLDRRWEAGVHFGKAERGRPGADKLHRRHRRDRRLVLIAWAVEKWRSKNQAARELAKKDEIALGEVAIRAILQQASPQLELFDDFLPLEDIPVHPHPLPRKV